MLNIVLTDNRVSGKCTEALLTLGYAAVRLPSFKGLSSPVASHPDMLCMKLRDGSLLITEEYYFSEKNFFDKLGVPVRTTEEKLVPEYPGDILFDALAVNGRVYGKKGFVSRYILRENEVLVPVRQGYARCSVAMLSERCAVTSDRGLASVLSEDGISVLLIRSGYIRLDGYNTGFIGGAGGRLRGGVYCFFGDLMGHPDGKAILVFAADNKISAVSLSDEPLSDYGGLVLL